MCNSASRKRIKVKKRDIWTSIKQTELGGTAVCSNEVITISFCFHFNWFKTVLVERNSNWGIKYRHHIEKLQILFLITPNVWHKKRNKSPICYHRAHVKSSRGFILLGGELKWRIKQPHTKALPQHNFSTNLLVSREKSWVWSVKAFPTANTITTAAAAAIH